MVFMRTLQLMRLRYLLPVLLLCGAGLFAEPLLGKWAEGDVAVVRVRPVQCAKDSRACRQFKVGFAHLHSAEAFNRDLTCILEPTAPSSSLTVFRLDCNASREGVHTRCKRVQCGGAGPCIPAHLITTGSLVHARLPQGRWDAHLEVLTDFTASNDPHVRCPPRRWWEPPLLWAHHFRVELLFLVVVVLTEASQRKEGSFMGPVAAPSGSASGTSESPGLNDDTVIAKWHRGILTVLGGALTVWHFGFGSGEHAAVLWDDFVQAGAMVFSFMLMAYLKEPGVHIVFVFGVVCIGIQDHFSSNALFDPSIDSLTPAPESNL